MLEQLFGSKTRLKLLRLIIKEDDKIFFVRELSRELDVQINAIRREIELLKEIELIRERESPESLDTSEPGVALRKYYGVNSDSPLFDELQSLLLKEQLLNEQELIQEIIDRGSKIKFLLATGKFTSEEDTPTDLLIVGNISSKFLEEKVREYEEKFDSEIKYTVMKEEEFLERHHIMDKFLYSLFESDHIEVVNDLKV